MVKVVKIFKIIFRQNKKITPKSHLGARSLKNYYRHDHRHDHLGSGGGADVGR
jgi:hypothetical protein